MMITIRFRIKNHIAINHGASKAFHFAGMHLFHFSGMNPFQFSRVMNLSLVPGKMPRGPKRGSTITFKTAVWFFFRMRSHMIIKIFYL